MIRHRVNHGTYSQMNSNHMSGPVQGLIEDDGAWSCIRSGMMWMNAAVWGVAAVIAVFVIGG